MWTRQRRALCSACGRVTNHVTHYQKNFVGDSLIADEQCTEHQYELPREQPQIFGEAPTYAPSESQSASEQQWQRRNL